MNKRNNLRVGRLALIVLGLAVAAGQGQIGKELEVPALVNTYRADPGQALPIATGTVNLSARAVEELYYESYISGFMQGKPAAASLGGVPGAAPYGLPAAPSDYQSTGTLGLADSYPILARTQRPEQRLPRMPITINSQGELLLHVRIDKLPTREACQVAVNQLMRLGLLPGEAPTDNDEGDLDVNADAIATGRWRLIIHPPRTKGAPPVPSLYFPEAVQLITPATKGADLADALDAAADVDVVGQFWDGVRVRWRDWDAWVREVFDPSFVVGTNDPQAHPADPDFGQEPMPFFLPFPKYLDELPLHRSDTDLRDKLQPSGAAPDSHNMWFDPARMYENRLLDPVQAAVDSGPAPERFPLTLAHTDSPDNRPLEFTFNWDGEPGKDPHQDGTGRLDGTWLQGVHTTGPSESDDPADDNFLGNAGATTPVGSTITLGTATQPAFSYAPTPLDVTINLTTGQWSRDPGWDGNPSSGHGAIRPQPVVPGVGMVELQFEYETSVAGQPDTMDKDWQKNPWGPSTLPPNGQYVPDTHPDYDSTQMTADPRGADQGDPNDDIPIEPEYVSYAVKPVADARGVDRDLDADADNPLILRDPIAQNRTEDETQTPVWRVRRFSGWPFNPAVIGLDDTPDDGPVYQGGPIVCRFLVGAIAALPEVKVPGTGLNPTPAQIAGYNPATDEYYPQMQPLIDSWLNPAAYLLGYRADNASATQDYFFPASPGSTTEAHRFYIRSVGSFEAGGTVQAWDNAADPGDAYRLRGPADLRETDQSGASPPDPLGLDRNVRFAYDLEAGDLPGDPADRMLHSYGLRVAAPGGGTWDTTTGPAGWGSSMARDDRPDLSPEAAGAEQVAQAFDMALDNGPDETRALVLPGYRLGKELEAESAIDRVEIYWHRVDASTPDLTDWAVEFATATTAESVGAGLFPARDQVVPDWSNAGTLTVPMVAPPAVAAGAPPLAAGYVTPPVGPQIFGVRLVNTGTFDLVVDELRLVTRADLRRTITGTMTSPLPSSDPDIVPTPLPDNAISVATVADRDIKPLGDNVVESTVKVTIPLRQRPSRDAVERQMLADNNQPPGNHTTLNQPTPGREGIPGAWDRYRGEVTVYLDDRKSTVRNPTDDTTVSNNVESNATLRSGHWDVKFFMVDNRLGISPTESFVRPAYYQFNTWYEEDSGWIGQGTYRAAGGDVTAARLAQLPVSEQRVSIEPYTRFTVETSVAYQRKLAIQEKLLDFGQVLHGGISQWVPITLTNEGNVPLRQIKLYLEQALTPVEFQDRGSAARMAQEQPVPAWFAQDLAIQSPGEEGTTEQANPVNALFPAPPGSTTGRAQTQYLRIGRLDPATPTDDRRVPVGQPLGNYSGRLRAFIDDLGVPGNDLPTDGNGVPDGLAETGLAGAATMKLTIKESPLWRIDDFIDNEIDRRRVRNPDLMPFDQATSHGSYQPVPLFNRLYSNPAAPEATPTIAVIQDPNDFTADPPNAGDSLWVGFSRRADQGGGSNWGVFYRDAPRPGFLSGSQILQTNYRAFRWPNLPEVQLSTSDPGQRNLYPNICVIPGSNGAQKQFLLLWHNEHDVAGQNKRASAIQFRRYDGTTGSGVLQIPDDATGSGLINKQVPRAFVDDLAGQNILWVTWQTGDTGQSRLGFNVIAMPAAANAPGIQYTDAIQAKGNSFVNYTLATPAGLTNLMSAWPLASYRNTVTNIPGVSGELQSINVFYSAFSPLWQNQDIYWSRYRPLEDPDLSTTDPIATVADGLKYSPMAESAYRLAQLTGPHPTTGHPAYWVRSLPGGRIPFPRVVNELLRTNANHTVYAAGSIDWVMPPDQPRVSGETAAGGWSVERFNHRGFADTDSPLFDQDRFATLAAGTADPNLDPLVILRVQRAAEPSANPAADPSVQRVGFNLERAYWDASANEWVLPLTGPAWLLDEGINVARVHPGLGRVTFNKPLYRRESQTPIYVFATYRPCAWRVTTSPSAEDQPTAAFDWWERLVIAWKRTVEGGKGELWYRTFSLSVPLAKAPVTRLRAVVNDQDAAGDQNFNGTPNAPLSRWSFTGAQGGSAQQGDGAWSEITRNPTSQGFQLSAFDARNAVTVDGAQGDAQAGWNAAGMVHFGIGDIGRRVRIWYDTPLSAGTPVEEAHQIVGLSPERRMPLSGDANESQPAIAPEHFYVGYRQGADVERIMSTRFWLAWVSTRDLYLPHPTDPVGSPPVLGTAGTNVFYGAFRPLFASGNLAE